MLFLQWWIEAPSASSCPFYRLSTTELTMEEKEIQKKISRVHTPRHYNNILFYFRVIEGYATVKKLGDPKN